MKYRKKLYQELNVGDIFCIKQEIDNYDYLKIDRKFILSYKKLGENKYESRMVIEDYRKNPTYKNPKITGFLYREAEVYELLN